MQDPFTTDRKTIDTALWELTKLMLDTLDFRDVVQRVVNNILDDLGYFERGYRILVLTLVDHERSVLRRIALSQTQEAAKAQEVSAIPFEQIDIPLSATDNLLIQTLTDKQVHVTHSWPDLFRPVLTDQQALQNQTAAGIKTSLLYPLLVKDQAIGVMIFSLVKGEEEVTPEEKDLIARFTDIAALAVQNARMYSDLKDALAKLQELDHLKDEFLAYASHELRTPLTAVRGYAQLLQKELSGTLTEKQQNSLHVIEESSGRVIKLVGNMLDVSRIQAGRFEILPIPTDLVSLVQASLMEVTPTAQEHQVPITVHIPTTPLPLVLADTDKIKEVLINLLGNAVKFTPAGGSITISFTQQNGMVTTTVKDTGKGVNAEDRQYLFQEYGMIKKNYLVLQEHQGTGLGLYISRSIVRLHGGDITLSSAGENKGTSVSFSLKVAEDAALQ